MTITAKIISDSISPRDIRITTLQLRYPFFFHQDFMTHRVFSRNASSSRAIPIERLIQDVMDYPAMPIHWGKNQPGMQAREECNNPIRPQWGEDDSDVMGREEAWLVARNFAVDMAKSFSEAGYHKQIANIFLFPFMHINVLVTSTEWDNFFELRDHPDARPEIEELAKQIKNAMGDSKPNYLVPGRWHLPYIAVADYIGAQIDEDDYNWLHLVQLSVARCARVSYLTQEGKQPLPEQDLKLYDRLVAARPLHASPAEHQATPDVMGETGFGETGWRNPQLHANFKGWIQYRKMIER